MHYIETHLEGTEIDCT